jgi:hypothetical protein
MSSGKLIQELRTICVYKKTKSKYLGDTIEEINIDHIPFDKIKEAVIAKPDDPFLLNVYELNQEQIEKFNIYLGYKIQPDFTANEYFLECYAISKKNKK